MIFDITSLLKKQYKKPAQFDNETLRTLYFRVMVNGLYSRFEWDVLPDDLKGKSWYIEKKLAETGLMGFAKDPETEHYMFLPAMPIGGLTMYGESPRYQLIGDNGVTFEFEKEDVAICYDNVSRAPISIPMAYEFASRISEVQRTCDVRVNKHKMPIVWKGPKKIIESLKNALSDLLGNQEALVFDDDTDVDLSKLDMFNSEIRFLNRDLINYKQDLLGEFFGYSGVNFNPANGKKERLVAEEQHSNDEQVLLFRKSFMKCRQDFCNEVMEKFGVEISVKYMESEANYDVVE